MLAINPETTTGITRFGMSDSADREKLKCLLNAGLELRKRLFGRHDATEESKTLKGELLRIAGTVRTMAVQLRHPHGQACAMELQLAARVWAMSCLYTHTDHTPNTYTSME